MLYDPIYTNYLIIDIERLQLRKEKEKEYFVCLCEESGIGGFRIMRSKCQRKLQQI